MKTITRDELKNKMESGEDFILVDVRVKESYELEHLPGAINIPLEEIDDGVESILDKNKEIVVYCSSFECERSPTAAKKLAEMGFNVSDFAGGLADWRDGGYPTEEI
jgi:rhodanese-related sulfurtransferase